MDSEQQYWERLATSYGRSMRLLGKPMPRAIALAVEEVRGSDNVLEVAAGTGLFTTEVAPVVGRLVATDYAGAMIQLLQQRVTALALNNVSCERADLYALQYPAASFDAVIAANVLHLVPDLAKALAAMRAVLRPGGKLIVPTFCHDETRLSWLLSRAVALTGFPGHRRFTASSLRTELERAGLRISTSETIPGPFPIGFAAGTFSGLAV